MKTKQIMAAKKLAVQILNDLEAEKGIIDPKDVVKIAEKPSSPLHRYFQWDDSVAGHQYRLMQARILITTVRVQYEGERKDAYFNVQVSGGRGYVSRDVVMSDKKMQRQVVHYAATQLKHWQETYRDVSELEGIIDEEKLENFL